MDNSKTMANLEIVDSQLQNIKYYREKELESVDVDIAERFRKLNGYSLGMPTIAQICKDAVTKT